MPWRVSQLADNTGVLCILKWFIVIKAHVIFSSPKANALYLVPKAHFGNVKRV